MLPQRMFADAARRLLAPLLLAGTLAGCATLPPPPPPLGYDEIARRVTAGEPEAQIVRDIRTRGVTGGSPPSTEDMASLETAGASQAIKDAALIAAWQPPAAQAAAPVMVGSPWWGSGWSAYPYSPWGWGGGYPYGPAIGVGIYGGGWRGSSHFHGRPPSAAPSPGGARPGPGSPFRPSFPRPVIRR